MYPEYPEDDGEAFDADWQKQQQEDPGYKEWVESLEAMNDTSQ